MRILCKFITFCALSILISTIIISSILYFISIYIHSGISPLHIMVLSIFTGLLTGAILTAIFPTKKGESMPIRCDLCDQQIQTKLNFICPDCVGKLNKTISNNGNNHHHEEELQPVAKKNTKRRSKPSKRQRSTVSTVMSKITGLNIGGKL